MIILAAPPAAAIRYVNESNGLEPSVYGGGGSPSSEPLPGGRSLVSRGSAALVSATALEEEGVSSNGGAGPASTDNDAKSSPAVMELNLCSVWGAKYSDENDGGFGEGKGVADEEDPEDCNWSCSDGENIRDSSLGGRFSGSAADTDEPSLESRGDDKVNDETGYRGSSLVSQLKGENIGAVHLSWLHATESLASLERSH